MEAGSAERTPLPVVETDGPVPLDKADLAVLTSKQMRKRNLGC
jgi:hypothetical protein